MPSTTPRIIKPAEKAATADGILFTFPRGYVYENMNLILGNAGAGDANAPAISACIGRVEVRMNGAAQRSAGALRMLAAHAALFGPQYGHQNYVGGGNGLGRVHYPILFREPRSRLRPDSVDTDILGWETGWLPANKPLQLFVQNVLGANLVCDVEATVQDMDTSASNGPRRIIKLYEDDNVLGANPVTLPNWTKGIPRGDRILQLSLFNSSAAKTVDSVRLEAGGTVFVEDIHKNSMISENRRADLDPAGANAVANAYHIVFDRNESLDHGLPSFESSKLVATFSANPNGESAFVVSQRYGRPDGAA